jgi:hypothetical protein
MHRQRFPATLKNRRAHDAELVRGISRIVRGGICMSRAAARLYEPPISSNAWR